MALTLLQNSLQRLCEFFGKYFQLREMQLARAHETLLHFPRPKILSFLSRFVTLSVRTVCSDAQIG